MVFGFFTKKQEAAVCTSLPRDDLAAAYVAFIAKSSKSLLF